MPTIKQRNWSMEHRFEHKTDLPVVKKIKKKNRVLSKVYTFLDKDEIVYAFKLNPLNISGYIRWRRKLFTEAYHNLQSVGHPNGYHHNAVARLFPLIKMYGFETIMNDLDNKLFDDVSKLVAGDGGLFAFENFTLKYKKQLDDEGYVYKSDVYHRSSGYPVDLPCPITQKNTIAYLLIENESNNWNFDKFIEKLEQPVDSYKVCNFATKDVVDFVIKLNDLSNIYDTVNIWFETEDLGGKYSELFKMMLISEVIPKNAFIVPTGYNDKFIKMLETPKS